MENSPLFIRYLNAPLKENPAHLREVCDAVEKEMEFPFGSSEDLNFLVYFVVLFSQKNRPELVDSAYASEDEDIVKKDLQRIIISAGEAVFGYRNDYCETACPRRKGREKRFGIEVFIGEDRLKCFQCEQMDFIALIDELMLKKEFGEISGFLPFLNLGYQYLDFVIKDEPSTARKSIFKTDIKKHINFQPDHPFYLGCDSDGKFGFLNFLNSLISYSLSEFLFQEDRRKIKKCQNCKQCFIANTVRGDQKFCSDKCRYQNHQTPEKRKEYQKKYGKKEEERLAQIERESKEKEIARLVKVSGYTRDEAIDLVEIDKSFK